MTRTIMALLMLTVCGMPQGAFSQCPAVPTSANLRQVIKILNCAVAQLPIKAQWPTAQEIGITPINTAKPNSLHQQKDFSKAPASLPYTPSFALISVIEVRDAGDAGNIRVDAPVVVVAQGRSATSSACNGMKFTLQGTSLIVDIPPPACVASKGGYPAMNVTFVP